MIFMLERLITQAINQTPLNTKGDKIAAIKVTQSDISVFSKLSYELKDENGVLDIAPVPKNQVVVYKDEFNIPLDDIDTYLRTRKRIMPIKSKSVSKEGRQLYNIRTLYKLNEPRALYLIVRDLYFRDTEEGDKVVKNMQLHEDVNKVDAKLFIVEYQASTTEDLVLSRAIKYGYRRIKYDKSFSNLFGINEDNSVDRIDDIPALHDKGGKILRLKELAFFTKSSIPIDVSYQTSISGSENYMEKVIEYRFPLINKPDVSRKIQEHIINSKGITLINNLLPDEFADYLMPRPLVKYEPRTVSCMQLEQITNNNPQYPIEVYDEYSVGENLDFSVTEHLELQKHLMMRKEYDIYILPDINLIDEEIVKKSVDSHIVVLIDSDNYSRLGKELTKITDDRLRLGIIDKLNSFIDININSGRTSLNKIHTSIKRMLKLQEMSMDKFELNDEGLSDSLLEKFLGTPEISVMTLSSGRKARFVKDSLSRHKVEHGENILDLNNIIHILTKLTNKDLLKSLTEKVDKLSLIRDFYHEEKKNTVKITIYTSSNDGLDLNITLRKYNRFSEESFKAIHGEEGERILTDVKEKLDDFINNNDMSLEYTEFPKKALNSNTSLVVDTLLQTGKSVLLVDPSLSLHERNFEGQNRNNLRILRTDSGSSVEEVAGDEIPDFIVFHKLSKTKDYHTDFKSIYIYHESVEI